MLPWEEIDRARVSGQDNDLVLRRRGDDYSIRTAGTELMNSRIHGSEEALADLVQARLHKKNDLNILVGGMGCPSSLMWPLPVAWRNAVFGPKRCLPG